MKKYRVNVNGNVYEVTLEVMEDGAPSTPAKPVQASPAPVASTPSAGKNSVVAPIPGTILSVNVSNGAKVKKGDVLMVLEAMKMENEIMAPCDGTVSSVNVQKGSAVQSGAVLCSID